MESFEPAWTVIHIGPDRYRIMVDPNFKINISFNGVSPESARRVLNRAMVHLPLNSPARSCIQRMIKNDRVYFSKDWRMSMR